VGAFEVGVVGMGLVGVLEKLLHKKHVPVHAHAPVISRDALAGVGKSEGKRANLGSLWTGMIRNASSVSDVVLSCSSSNN
jgi:hypothetical protein